MPHRRIAKKGSFGSHFDELVKHFPHHASQRGARRSQQNACALQEKRDIHALLFERAWGLNREREDEGAR